MRVTLSTFEVSSKELAFWSRLASGTRTPERWTSAFCTTRSAILSWVTSKVMPSVPFSTTNPFTWASAWSRAQMTTRSANEALPIHFFSPSRTHSSPSRRAVVARPPAIPEPVSGSVSPKAPISSIRAIAGSHRSRCSSEPQRSIEPMASPPCTPMKVCIDASTRAISMATMPSSRAPRAGHPGPSYWRPAMPSAASPGTSSCGNSARVQYPLITGSTSDTMNSAHLPEQLAALVVEQQLEAQEVRVRGVVQVQLVAHGVSGVLAGLSVRNRSTIGASSRLSVRMPRWPPW